MMSVSRVLNDNGRVGPDARARIQRAIHELNYIPNQFAKALVSNQPAHEIAFLFERSAATALGDMLGAAFAEATRSSVSLTFVGARTGDHPLQTLKAIEDLGIRAVILPPPLCDDQRLRMTLGEAGIRIAAVGFGGSDPGLSSIGIDDEQAAYDLTRYLLEIGHRRIGFVAGHPRYLSSVQRRAGFERAITEFGIGPTEELHWEAYDAFGSAVAAAQQALALNPRPTAIIASDDKMAATVIAVATGRGIAVPRSLSVCGFDDGEIALMTRPRLTTVRRPVEAMVAWGIRQLAGELSSLRRGQEPAISKEVLEHAIAFRDSDAPPDRA